MLKSLTRNQKESSDFFQMFSYVTFCREIHSIHLTMPCLKCLFHMENHIELASIVIFVEWISRQTVTWENIWKQVSWLFLVCSRRFQHFRHLSKTLIFFGTQSTSLPPGGQQPALPSHLQSVPKPAQQLGPSSCLPHGCQQLTLPGHLQEATRAALLPGRSSCLPPGGQQLVLSGHLQTAPWPAQLPGRSSCLPPNG